MLRVLVILSISSALTYKDPLKFVIKSKPILASLLGTEDLPLDSLLTLILDLPKSFSRTKSTLINVDAELFFKFISPLKPVELNNPAKPSAIILLGLLYQHIQAKIDRDITTINITTTPTTTKDFFVLLHNEDSLLLL